MSHTSFENERPTGPDISSDWDQPDSLPSVIGDLDIGTTSAGCAGYVYVLIVDYDLLDEHEGDTAQAITHLTPERAREVAGALLASADKVESEAAA